MWIVGLLLLGVGALFGMVLVMFVAGAFVPKHHSASSRIVLKHDQEEVWKVIADFERTPEWWPEIKEMERLDDRDGKPVWRQHVGFRPLTMEVTTSDEPNRLVTTIADDDLPFDGSWTYELAPAEGGCALTITEDGNVKVPPFRFMAHFFTGYHATQFKYLRALAKKLGEDAEPAVVSDAANGRN